MEITILKNFRFAHVDYKAGQKAPSKRFPKVPFDSIQIQVLKDLGNISVQEVKKAVKEKGSK